MPGVLRIFVLVAMVVLAAGSLFLLLPWMKEGFDVSDLPRFAVMWIVLVMLATLWARFSKRAYRMVGLLILALPLIVYTSVTGKLMFNVWYGGRIEAQTHIKELRATPIEWPGFDGPVGLHLELELEHPRVPELNLFTPKIVLDGSSGDYFSLTGAHRAVFMAPLFPIGRETPRNILDNTSAVHLTYDLYPSAIHEMSNSQRVCFWNGSPGHREYILAAHPFGSWLLATSGGATADLSRQLTAALLRCGVLPTGKQVWSAMLARLQPDGLVRAGYAQCADSGPERTSTTCYCR